MLSLWLPLPPSVNHIWRHARGRTYPSANYTKWLKQADLALATQGIPSGIKGPVEVRLVAYRGKGWVERKRDLDNMWKPCLDFMVRRGLIESDDHQIVKRLVADISPEHTGMAGVMLVIKKYGGFHEPI